MWPGSSLNIKSFSRDERGGALLEFGLGAPILATVVIASMEFGAVMLTNTLMESSLREAARFGITGQQLTGITRLERIIEIIDERTLGLVDMNEADVNILVYPSFSDVGRGEDYVDGNANGQYDAGETFTDENANGQWDADVGAAGSGASGDIVAYRLSYDWQTMTPFASHFIGNDGVLKLKASIVVRNEPWDGLNN
ncbi:MAG: pilus assembly protein [Rhodospirillales bacterium]|nr:pilus assembly protein [Rhodospirillales bacterium]MBO6788737.1 pilus assembly protein [Rhodospirillales bacterium]